MSIQYDQGSSSTNSLGRIGFITTTAAVFAVSGFTAMPQGYHALNEQTSPKVGQHSSIGIVPFFDWEARLRGTESSGHGGEDLYISDSSNFAQLYAFALKLLGDQTDIPPEFNKVFKESFWDILA